MKYLSLIAIVSLAALALVGSAQAQTRLKDIAVVQGVRGNQLAGYGIVVGLAGSGDSTNVTFTEQSVSAMLQKFGVTVSPTTFQLKNAAAVMVTANLPAFARNGSTIDVTVSSLGDATSLQGGTLLQTPLQAANGLVYAVAQGAISVGGFTVGGGGGGAGVTKNHPTAGRIPAGALVEQDVPTTLAGASGNTLMISLDSPDFTTASRIAQAIENDTPAGVSGAVAIDAGTVQVTLTSAVKPGSEPVDIISGLENLPIQVDQEAKVVINERTGTVVMGGDVVVTACAIAHGNLTVQVSSEPVISQPNSRSGGKTVVKSVQTIKVKEDAGDRLMAMPTSTTLSKVVSSLNMLGVTPRDLIAILQAMKEAGALQAEVVIE